MPEQATSKKINPFLNQGLKEILDEIGKLLFEKGFMVTRFCHGYQERFPSIRFEVHGKPEFQYKGQEECLQKTIDKYGVTKDEVLNYDHYEAWCYYDFLTYSVKRDKTQLYQAWEEVNIAHGKKVVRMFDHFLSQVQQQYNFCNLTISVSKNGTVTLKSLIEQMLFLEQEIIPEEIVGLIVKQFELFLNFLQACKRNIQDF